MCRLLLFLLRVEVSPGETLSAPMVTIMATICPRLLRT